jgi:uncharacterized protein
MFLVGGGILAHGVHPVEVALTGLTAPLGLLGAVLKSAGEGLFGALAGGLVLAVVTKGRRLGRRPGLAR